VIELVLVRPEYLLDEVFGLAEQQYLLALALKSAASTYLSVLVLGSVKE
jgi:hypothetical protein